MATDFVLTASPESLQDYWRVYLASRDELYPVLLEEMLQDPVFGPMFRSFPPELLAEQRRIGDERQEKGIAGDWGPYLAALRTDGATYAAMGVPVESWFRLMLAMRRHLTPKLVEAYHTEPARLTSVLFALNEMTDVAMAILSETYVDAKQRHVEEQKTLAEDRARELAASERTLKDRTATFEAVFATMRDGVAFVLPDLRLAVLNDAAAGVLQPRRDEAGVARWDGSTTLREKDGVTALPAARHPLSRALEGEVVRGLECQVHPPGHEAPMRLLIDAHPVRVDGELLGALFAFRDITESARLAELVRRSEELEHQNQLAQEASRLKSEFLANMSHELRTPLNAIIGFSELIHDGVAGPTSATQLEFLGDILTSSRHLLQLINDILDLSKIEAGKLQLHPERVDVAVLVREVTAVLRGTAGKKNLDVAVEADPSLPVAVLDPGRVKQVLYNYLSNAIKFTPDGGRIRVRLLPAEPHALRLEVSDTGRGISAEAIPRLFRDFEQLEGSTNKRQGGTGLGLALTRRLVEAMGGSVGVHSTVGEGSTFFAVFPAEIGVASALRRPRALPGATSDAPRILVVEDDPDDQTLLVQLLTEQGYAVMTASTGAQANLLCREETFDAITLDLVLPDASGLDVLRLVRAGTLNRATPVVVISISAEDRLAAAFSLAGVLPKPIQPSALREALVAAGVLPRPVPRVLVVDDDAASLRLAEVSLSELGYAAVCFDDPLAALAWLATERPGAVLLDLLMPALDGFSFIARMQQRPELGGLPVFVWTVKDLTPDERIRLRERAHTEVLTGKRSGHSLVRELAALLPASTKEVVNG